MDPSHASANTFHRGILHAYTPQAITCESMVYSDSQANTKLLVVCCWLSSHKVDRGQR